jgi:hypothetical protein
MHTYSMNSNFNEIYYYFRKWNNIILSTNRINRNETSLLIDKAYRILGLSDVSLISLSSPNNINADLQNSLKSSVVIQLKLALKHRLVQSILDRKVNAYSSALEECNKYISRVRIDDIYI